MLKAQNRQLKDLIAKGRLDKVIEELKIYTQSLSDQHYYNAAAQLSARWNANERALNLGTLSNTEYNTERNKISHAVLELMDDVAANSPQSIPYVQAPSASHPLAGNSGEHRFWKKLGYVAIIAGILGGFAEFFNFINFVPNRGDEAMQLTVFVQGANGKPIAELQNKGQIIVDFGNDRRAPLIGEYGRTNLGEIPAKFRGEKIPLVLQAEGYEPVDSAKQYVMDGEQIYFLVQRDNSLGLVQGIVKDRSGETLIAGALVMINQETTITTDSLGRFKIVLPIEKHAETYTLMVKKDGYKTKNEYYKPKSGPIEIRLDR